MHKVSSLLPLKFFLLNAKFVCLFVQIVYGAGRCMPLDQLDLLPREPPEAYQEVDRLQQDEAWNDIFRAIRQSQYFLLIK